jgi:hypothetical protein
MRNLFYRQNIFNDVKGTENEIMGYQQMQQYESLEWKHHGELHLCRIPIQPQVCVHSMSVLVLHGIKVMILINLEMNREIVTLYLYKKRRRRKFANVAQ